jgi:hypothetical protein
MLGITKKITVAVILGFTALSATGCTPVFSLITIGM